MASRRLSIRINSDLERKLRSEAALRRYFKEQPNSPTCYGLARKAGLIGTIRTSPTDLSTSRYHFERFGK